ncbi:MAG: ATP-binding cassette domain-containing protein [candidate division FCPU426 bacterium]
MTADRLRRFWLPAAVLAVHAGTQAALTGSGWLPGGFSFSLALLGVNVLLAAWLAWGQAEPASGLGFMLIIAGHGLVGHALSPTAAASAVLLLSSLLTVYVVLKLWSARAWPQVFVYIASYLAMFVLFFRVLENAEPLFLIALLGLAGTARHLRLVACLWAIILAFTLAQPFAWETAVISLLILKILFTTRMDLHSRMTWLFLGVGLLLLFGVLFPVATLIFGQSPHNLLLVLRDREIVDAIGVTLFTATVATLLLGVIVLPLAYAVARTDFWGKPALLSVIDIPIVIPQSVAGIALLSVFGKQQILGGWLFDAFGLRFDGTMLGIILAQVFVALPFFFRSALAAYEAVPSRYEGTARTLGANSWLAFLRVTLPLAGRGLFLGAVMAWARAAGEFGAVFFIAASPETAPVAVYSRFLSSGLAETAPLVSVLLLFSLGMFFLLQWTSRMLNPVPQDHPHSLPASRQSAPGNSAARTRASASARRSKAAGRSGLGSASLQMQNLCLRLGAFQLGPLSLEVRPNEYMVLLGPTGSGKSSLLNALAGFHRLPPRTVRLAGRDVSALPPNRRPLGYMVQGNDLFPHLTVAQNLAFGLRMRRVERGERDRRVARFLELFRLEPLARRGIQHLSGGEQRKVALARSLITEPELLLLDEPLGMLDAPGRREISDVLRDMHSELRTTTLHVTHDRQEAWALGGRCAVMSAGRILQVGPLAEIFRAPQDRFTAEFLGGRNFFPVDVKGRRIRTAWGHWPLRPGWKAAGEALAMVRPEHVEVHRLPGPGRFSGRVTGVRDFGAFMEIVVALSAGPEITAHATAPWLVRLRPGARAYLGWPPDRMHLLPGGTHD